MLKLSHFYPDRGVSTLELIVVRFIIGVCNEIVYNRLKQIKVEVVGNTREDWLVEEETPGLHSTVGDIYGM